MKTMTLERCYASEYSDWDLDDFESIPFNMTDTLRLDIIKATALTNEHGLRSVTLNVPGECWDEKSHDALQDACAFDVAYISVYSHGGAYLTIQAKFDCSLTAEFAFNE